MNLPEEDNQQDGQAYEGNHSPLPQAYRRIFHADVMLSGRKCDGQKGIGKGGSLYLNAVYIYRPAILIGNGCKQDAILVSRYMAQNLCIGIRGNDQRRLLQGGNGFLKGILLEPVNIYIHLFGIVAGKGHLFSRCQISQIQYIIPVHIAKGSCGGIAVGSRNGADRETV